MLKSVARLGAMLLSICAEAFAGALQSFALCALRRAKAPGRAIDRYIVAEGGKIAEGGTKNAECRNKEMAISRRLEGLRSSRLDHSMQNFMAEV